MSRSRRRDHPAQSPPMPRRLRHRRLRVRPSRRAGSWRGRAAGSVAPRHGRGTGRRAVQVDRPQAEVVLGDSEHSPEAAQPTQRRAARRLGGQPARATTARPGTACVFDTGRQTERRRRCSRSTSNASAATSRSALNGRRIFSGGRMEEPITRNCHYPQLVTLPGGLLLSSGNVLDLHVQGHAAAARRRAPARRRALGAADRAAVRARAACMPTGCSGTSRPPRRPTWCSACWDCCCWW